MRRFGSSAIDKARSAMATEALRDGYQELMWIDSDIAFEPDAVDALRAADEPLICGIYPKKGQRDVAAYALPGTEKLVFGQDGGIVELLYGGMGFLLSRACVYAAIRETLALPVCDQRFKTALIPYFLPMVVPDGAGHWYLPEDYAFCERARRAGYRVLADTRIRLRHIGRYEYSWEDADTQVARQDSYVLDCCAWANEPTAEVSYPVDALAERVLFEALVESVSSAEESALARRLAREGQRGTTIRQMVEDLRAQGEFPGDERWGERAVLLSTEPNAPRVTVHMLEEFLSSGELSRDAVREAALFFRSFKRVLRRHLRHHEAASPSLSELERFGDALAQASDEQGSVKLVEFEQAPTDAQ